MNKSIRNIVCCLTAVILLVTTSGCDWMFPLTSPSRATVDKRLIGYWKLERVTEDDAHYGVVALSDCSKLSKAFLENHPNLPRGATWMQVLDIEKSNPSPSATSSLSIFWPTTIGSTTYLNLATYDTEDKKLRTGSRSYIICKYVVAGDSVTIYLPDVDASNRINSRLGKDYNSADLLQEITKVTDWKMTHKLSRIRF